MHSFAIVGVLVAIDFFLKSLAAFETLGTLLSTRQAGLAVTVERWRAYPKSWESLFATCLDALTLVTLVLQDAVLKDRHGLIAVDNAELRDALGGALGAGDRLAIVRANYDSALAAFERAQAAFLAARTGENYRARESADTSRGLWYNELHVSFNDYERKVKRLRPLLVDYRKRLEE